MKLGIMGMSEGNGHPYSWSAIFNGYEQRIMKECPFPAIPEYLGKQNFPEDSLGDLGRVTHIWTQSRGISEHIAKAGKIKYIVEEAEDMIGVIDGLLLARDDAENHYAMALPFLKAGIPIFIDKPLALSRKEAEKILNAQKYENQIFTCSSLRYAEELQLSANERKEIGAINHVEASVPKKWDTYAIHLLEPVITQIPNRGALKNVSSFEKNGIRHCFVEWEEISGYFKVTGATPSPLRMEYFGEKGTREKVFTDAFSCFKSSLERFIKVASKEAENIDPNQTMEIIQIIEKGRL